MWLAGKLDDFHVLVTGAAGFLGKRLIRELIRHDAKVLGVDVQKDSVNIDGDIKLPGGYHFIQSKLTSSKPAIIEFLSGAPKKNRMVFHMAGIADASVCRSDPGSAYNGNVDLTFRVLEICREIKGATVIFPSTGLVYGTRLNRPATEEDRVFPLSMYVASKLSAEFLAASYSHNYCCPSIILRLSNIYGPGSSKETVIGRMLKQVEEGKPVEVFDTTPVRDFIFIDDVIEAFIRLVTISMTDPSTTINISTGIGHTVGEVVDIVTELSLMMKNKSMDKTDPKRPNNHLVMSNHKLKDLTGWTPRTGLYHGLEKSLNDRSGLKP